MFEFCVLDLFNKSIETYKVVEKQSADLASYTLHSNFGSSVPAQCILHMLLT